MPVHSMLKTKERKTLLGMVGSKGLGYNCVDFLTGHHSQQNGSENLADGSVGKVVAIQARGPEFRSSVYT